jgi:hypothetical protein
MYENYFEETQDVILPRRAEVCHDLVITCSKLSSSLALFAFEI